MTKYLLNNTRNTTGNSSAVLDNRKGFFKSIILSICIFVGISGGAWGQTFSIVGSGTSGSGFSYANPYNNGYYGNKTQQFVTAAQLTASGIAANSTISQLGFKVTTIGTGAAANLSGFTIKVYTTASTNPLTAWVTSSQVAQSTPVTLNVGTTGWKMTTLQSSFVWNGTSNLVIETCYNNNTFVSGCAVEWTGTGLGTGTWSRWYRADNSTVCSSTLLTSTSTSSRPNIRFAWSGAAVSACSGTPAPGNTVTSSASVAPGSTVNLSLSTPPTGSGLTYQWQSSTTSSSSGFTSISGATSATYTATVTATTWYQCIVTCSGATGTSAAEQVSLAYCTPTGTPTYYISNVTTTGGAINISNATAANAGYGNFTAQSASNSIGTGTSFSVSHSATYDGAGVGVWIDWNNDLDFADANEQIGVTTSWNFSPYTGTINIPVGTPAGNKRMRIVIDYNVISPISCPVGITGETEDYTFTVTAVSACSGTPNAGAASISSASVCASTTFNLSATGLSSGTGITYQWQSSPNNSTWTNITNATASTYSTSIASGLMYYRIQTSCTSSGITSSSSSVSATAVSCINMSNGSTTLTGNANFYDTGGSGANYTSYQAYTYTVYPASCNNVSAVFSSFATESCCDYMIVYNGNSTSAPSLGTFYTMTTNQTFNSTAADGSLTFYFYSDVSVEAAGWAATLSNIAISAGPAVPTGFAGLLNPEVGSTQTYSVTAVSGATYAWSFPSGWVINSGQGTNSVSVTVGGTNGNISITPTRCSLAGTAYSVATTIPNYRWKYISSNLGSATWTGGEARNIDITIKNTGVSTWNTTYVNNIGVLWNSTNSSLTGTPWSDFHSRVTVGSLAAGASGTITLPIEAKDATAGPTYSTNLADGMYYLAFDMVSEGQCWFSGNTGICGPGNTMFYSAAQTVASTPSLSCSALTAFGNVCTDASATNSFTVSGVNLTNNISIAALSGYSYSTSAGGTYTSTLTLTPSSGSISQIVYVNFTPTAASAYTGNIVATSTGATSQNVAASGTGIQATTVNAGSDFNLCSGQSVPMNASTSATSVSGSVSATYSAGNGNSLYNYAPSTTTNSSCPMPLSVNIPSGAVITSVNVSYNMTAANGAYMSEQQTYLKCTNSGGVSEASMSGGSGLGGTMPYSRPNLTIANAVSGGGTINFELHAFRTWGGTGCEAVYNYVNNNTFTVTVNYTINPTYTWSPATALSATNVLNPNCSATSTTTYTLTVTGTNGCVASDQVVASVAGSASTASAGGALSAICSGATSAAMGGSVGGAATGGTWTGGAGTWTNATNPATATYTAGANETGTLALTLTTSGGVCGTATATKTIVVNALPVVSAGPDQTICNGQTAQLAGVISYNANLINEAFESGAFPPSGWSTAVTNAAYTWGTTTGVAGMSGTSARVGWNYTQNEKLRTPSVSLSNLSASSLQFDMSMSYYWSVSPYNNMDFNVKVSSDGGSTWTSVWSEASLGAFTSYQTYPITVNLASYLGGNIIVSFEYVGNDAADLYLDNVKIIGTPTLAYSWSPSAALSNAAISNPVATQSTSTIYTLTGTLLGCSSIDAMTVTVTPTNTVSAASSSPTLCNNIALTAITHTTTGATGIGTATGLPAGVTAAWASNTITISGTPSASGTFSYSIPLSGGCGSVNATGTITVLASPTANAGADITGASTCGKNTVTVNATALNNNESGAWTVITLGTGATLPGSFSAVTTPTDDFTGSYGGTYTLAWTVTNTATNCTNTDNMVVTFNQPITTSLGSSIGNADFLWNGLTSVDWSTGGNWFRNVSGEYQLQTGTIEPTNTNQVFSLTAAQGGVCIGSNMPTIGNGDNALDVFVGSGITLNLASGSLNLSGNLVNNGTINAAQGTINFIGSTNATVSGSGTTTLNNVTINKSSSATLTLSTNVAVNGILNMTQGNVVTAASPNGLLTLGTSSAVPGTLTWTSGNIVGPFRRFFTTAATQGNEGLFPVGTATYQRYAKVNFAASPGTNQTLTAWYKAGTPMSAGAALYNGLPLTTQDGQLIQNYSADGYWQIDPTDNNYTAPINSANYSIDLYANNLTGMQDPTICRIIKAAGSNTSSSNHVQWQGCGTHTTIPTGTSASAFVINSTVASGFSWFGAGTSNNQALPVELTSFSGNCADGKVDLEWSTATEHNSAYFQVEYSRDGSVWQNIGVVAAAGNSVQNINYTLTHEQVASGNNYYRLRQVDIDGVEELYDAIAVTCTAGSDQYIMTYPNPSEQNFQVEVLDENLIGTATLSMVDARGMLIHSELLEVKAGTNLFLFNNTGLAPGIYYVKISKGAYSSEVVKQVVR